MLKNIMLEDREGEVSIEYVLVTAMAASMIIAVFKALGPAIAKKVQEIAGQIGTSGAEISGIGK